MEQGTELLLQFFADDLRELRILFMIHVHRGLNIQIRLPQTDSMASQTYGQRL